MDTEQVPKKSNNVAFFILGLIIMAAGLIAWQVRPATNKQPEDTNEKPPTLKTAMVRPGFVADGLTGPTAIVSTPDPSDKRLFVLEQSGIIRTITSGTLDKAPFLDIHTKVKASGEMGLLGLAFHPDFTHNGYFFVNYIDLNQNTVIARYQVSQQTHIVDPSSEKVLLTLKQPYENHNGGDLVFGPDGYLYIALGDGGSGGDPENRAQNKTVLFGKILRIDVNSGDPYSIPASNPFVNEPNTKPEIWAYGLRNPWRISFDAKTHDLYIADVGQNNMEEVNLQKASSKGGENYGWRCYEGSLEYDLNGCKDKRAYVAPILEYEDAKDTCTSLTGGYVYRGSAYPALDGKYFYGDYCSGQLFSATQVNGVWTKTLATETPYAISAFGQGSDKELYFADYKTGSLYQIQDAAN